MNLTLKVIFNNDPGMKCSFASPVLSLITISALLLACSSSDPEVLFPDAAAESAIAQYKKNAYAEYSAIVASAEALSTSVDAFLASPSASALEAARRAWIAARIVYGPSEVHRFYEGPIDNPETDLEGRINGWPMDEFEIDYTRDTPNSGIINDETIKDITKQKIAAENGRRGEKAITAGWHAVEFLLWGQDDATAGTGAGKRPFTDYVEGGTAKNQKRRAEYLKEVTTLLVDDLKSVAAEWTPGVNGNYASTFGATATDAAKETNAKREAIQKILFAMGTLAKVELSGERMTVALKNRSEEDEHSCFSDTTGNDVYGNGLGIENVWLGRYAGVDGAGIDDVVRAASPDLATRMSADIADSVAKLKKLKDLQEGGKPIDVILVAADGDDGRVAMTDAIVALKKVAADTVEAGVALGITLELEAPSEEL